MNFFVRYHHIPRTEKEREELYGRVRWIAHWLDSAANLGGLHVGLEAMVGLIPVVGKKPIRTTLLACMSFCHRCSTLLILGFGMATTYSWVR